MFPSNPDTVNWYLLDSSPTANVEYSAYPFSPENLWSSTRSSWGLFFVSRWRTSFPKLQTYALSRMKRGTKSHVLTFSPIINYTEKYCYFKCFIELVYAEINKGFLVGSLYSEYISLISELKSNLRIYHQ